MKGELRICKDALKQAEKELKEANRKLDILKKNGITVDKGMICLGIKFSFDFTQICRLNGWYQNEIERLEKELLAGGK